MPNKPTSPEYHVGIVGTGSVGSIVAEALARTGAARITLIDFDTIELHNLDRLLHAHPRDARTARTKVEVLSKAIRKSAAAADPKIETFEYSIVEPQRYAAALDCDVLFSCRVCFIIIPLQQEGYSHGSQVSGSRQSSFRPAMGSGPATRNRQSQTCTV